MKRIVAATALAAALLPACGTEVEFTATDAEGVAGVVDAALTEESGLQGLITADDFTQADVDEFNGLAEDACADLADGFSAEEYADFESGVVEETAGMEDMLDIKAMTRALINTTCPSYLQTFDDAAS